MSEDMALLGADKERHKLASAPSLSGVCQGGVVHMSGWWGDGVPPTSSGSPQPRQTPPHPVEPQETTRQNSKSMNSLSTEKITKSPECNQPPAIWKQSLLTPGGEQSPGIFYTLCTTQCFLLPSLHLDYKSD